jgi:iron(III) transport system substrate-binding protein
MAVPFPRLWRRVAARLLPLALALAPACAKQPDVVLYCALDQVFSEELVRDFERETGLVVRAEFDVEAQKTVGLVTRLREERARPRCDVFWNNEIAHTVDLAEEGLLAVYDSPAAADIPERFRDPQRRWTGFAARARVFIVNTEQADPSTIKGFDDLLDPRWKGKVCMARPLTGTTLTHLTALYVAWGEERVRAWLERATAEDSPLAFVQSNGQVMRLVREGQMAWGLTDTDDLRVAEAMGFPVVAVYPDQGTGGQGTFLIPNTVALLADAPHPEAGRRLVDFILSRQVEARLAASDSAQIPVRADVPRPAHVADPAALKVLEVDWSAVARELGPRTRELSERFVR